MDAAADIAAWQRGDLRESMLLMATLSSDRDESDITLRVRNLSAGGLMAECDQQPAEGETVRVALRGLGEVGGVVAWSGNGRVGIRFDRPIDPRATRKPVAGASGSPKVLVSLNTRRPGVR